MLENQFNQIPAEQYSSPDSRQYLNKQLRQVFGAELSQQELNNCAQKLEILAPSLGKRFWRSDRGQTGLYLILAGKVRLIDRKDNLFASQEAGKTFGELTLFSSESFQPYSAKASRHLQLGYISSEILQPLLKKHSALRNRLYEQAVMLDLLLLSRQSDLLQTASVKDLIKTITLFKRHTLATGQLPNSLREKQQLWLVRTGEILERSGTKKLSAGSIHAPSGSREWQVTQPSELYALSNCDLEIARAYLPQLSQLIEGDRLQKTRALPTRELETEEFTASAIAAKPQKTKQGAYFPSPIQKVGHLFQLASHRYPFYAQQSASDCGAACLVMVGMYWGKRFSINRLRDIANVNRSGSSLRGLTRAAESIGFDPRPVKASFDRLQEQKLPAIVHWQRDHYVVLYEISDRQVIIGDPALGQKTLTHEQFKADWTGYLLLLEPTAWFKQVRSDRTSFWQFWELVKPHRFVLLEVFAASMFIQIFGLITPIFTQLILDRVVVQRSDLTLMAVGTGLLIFSLFRVAMTGLRQYLLHHTANKVDMALIVGFIRHTLRLPLSFFESRYVGDIMSRVQENHKIQRFLTGEALSILLDLFTLFVYVGLMSWYSWKMTLLALTIVPPFFLLALTATPFLRRISRQIFQAYAKESSYLIEALSGIRTVKSTAVEHTVRWHWEELLNQEVKTRFSGQIIGNLLQIVSNTIQAFATTGMLWFGAYLVIHNQLTVGQLVAFNMLLVNVIRPFQRLTVLWNQLQEVTIAVERINDVLDCEPEEDLCDRNRQFLPRLRGEICFEQISFRYHSESDTNVLENLSFKIEPGQMVALVGRSGSGKTTIAKLILGLYPPTVGRLLIDGQDINKISLRSLRQQIGVVDQDTFLFGGTIRENICLARPCASLEEIVEAARLAGADEFVQKLPLGYETEIGESGGMLSGGQRQRLAIARALLGNPRLLILDEATSHLDAESEGIIQRNLNEISKDTTTLVIAHRLSTVRRADLILVLDRGLLIESGTHRELMAERGHYFYLNQQQLNFA